MPQTHRCRDGGGWCARVCSAEVQTTKFRGVLSVFTPFTRAGGLLERLGREAGVDPRQGAAEAAFEYDGAVAVALGRLAVGCQDRAGYVVPAQLGEPGDGGLFDDGFEPCHVTSCASAESTSCELDVGRPGSATDFHLPADETGCTWPVGVI